MLLTEILRMRDQAHILHLQTNSYAEHNALQVMYEGLVDIFDRLIETYQGKYGRIYFQGTGKIELINYDDTNLQNFIHSSIKFLNEDIWNMGILDKKQDADIEHIVFEAQNLLSKVSYLLTLK